MDMNPDIADAQKEMYLNGGNDALIQVVKPLRKAPIMFTPKREEDTIDILGVIEKALGLPRS